jgi:hypothetical protein
MTADHMFSSFRRGLLVVAPAVIGLAIAAAACGGGSPAGVASLGTTTTAAPAGARDVGGPASGPPLVEYATCMRAHGVPTFPDPNPTTGAMNPPAGIDRGSPQVIAALRACSSLGEAAGLGPPST